MSRDFDNVSALVSHGHVPLRLFIPIRGRDHLEGEGGGDYFNNEIFNY